jgi:hypothetical protein
LGLIEIGKLQAAANNARITREMIDFFITILLLIK